MWVAKARVRHDCVIGNRCKKFKVQTIGASFSVYVKNGKTHAPQVHTVYGRDEDVRAFIQDLESEPRIIEFETEGNRVFFIEVRKDKIPSSYYDPKLVHVKPVMVDTQGYEYWELASWDKNYLIKFVGQLKKSFPEYKLMYVQQSKLKEAYFQRLSPQLSSSQKRALQVAIEEGYYNYPRKTELRKLAAIMKISLATYREHLRRAEQKIIPDLLVGLK